VPTLCPDKTGTPEKGQSDKILLGLTASPEVVIKSWKSRIISSPFGDCAVTAGRDQKASFGSFRIAMIIRLRATVLRVDNNVFHGKQAQGIFC